MTELTGDRDIIEAALEQAGQTIFSAADVPLARADELAAIVTGAAVKAVLEARIAQVVKHGHTPAADAAWPLRKLPADARSMLVAGMDLMEGPHRNLVVGRRRFAKAAAMLLAAIDRVDLELSKGGQG